MSKKIQVVPKELQELKKKYYEGAREILLFRSQSYFVRFDHFLDWLYEEGSDAKEDVQSNERGKETGGKVC